MPVLHISVTFPRLLDKSLVPRPPDADDSENDTINHSVTSTNDPVMVIKCLPTKSGPAKARGPGNREMQRNSVRSVGKQQAKAESDCVIFVYKQTEHDEKKN